MLYQVEQRGRQTAFVGEDGAGLVGLYPLLARAAAIAENENSSFAEALSLAAAERGTPLRRVFADEAEALSHDLGHGGAAEQRAVIDLDNGRIRLEYDHRAGSLRESLDALANHFPTAGANRIQNRLIAFLAEHDGSEELYKTLHNELGLTNQEIEAMGFDLAHRYEPDCDDAYQDIVDYIRFEQETSKMWPWLISGDEMLAQETTLREIAGRLTAAGEWDTESIYESLTEAFGNNLSLDKQSKDDTKEKETSILNRISWICFGSWRSSERNMNIRQSRPTGRSGCVRRLLPEVWASQTGYSGRNCSGRRVKLSSPSTGSPAASATM